MINEYSYLYKLLVTVLFCINIFSGCDSNKLNNKEYGEYLFNKYTEITEANLKGIKDLNTADLNVFQGHWATFEKFKKDISESNNKADDKDPILEKMKTEILKYVEENIKLWQHCSLLISYSPTFKSAFLFAVFPDDVKKQIDVVTESMVVAGTSAIEISKKYNIDKSELEKVIKK